MKLIYKISAYLLVFSGLLQLAFSPVFFSQFGLEVLWFGGTGLGFVFLGNLNLVVMLSEKFGFYIMAITSNILGLMLTIVILSILNSIQAYIGLGIMTLVLISSITQYIQQMKAILNKDYTVRH